MRPKIGDDVIIYWSDIHAVGTSWHDEDKTLKPSPCRTRGVILEYEKTYIKVCATDSEEEHESLFDEICIPIGCIREIWSLQKSKKLTLTK